MALEKKLLKKSIILYLENIRMPYDLNLVSRPKQFLELVKFQHCLFDPTEREPRDTQGGPINSFICNNYRHIY